jgi:tetratricopeptide (TPR) repeat protein
LQEVCAGLCDSLGRNTEAREASQRLLACPGHESTPEEHLELADSFRLAGNTESAVTALRVGFQQFPASIRMRLTLAESLSNRGEHNEAVRLLAFEPLRENPGAMDLLVSEAVEATNADVAVSFIGNEPPPCLQDLPFSSLRLSFLLDRLSRRPESEKIVADLLHDSRYRQTETWLELGNMCLSIGDDAHAEAFVELYISSNGTSISKAWELLGDIYQDEERNEEALTAYKKAVEVIGTKSPTGITPDHPSVKVSQNDASVR